MIVGINYAPEETGIGPYTSGMAEHIATTGWQVTVVTGMPHYPQWAVPREYRWRVRVAEQARGVDIRRFRHFTPKRQSVSGRALYEASFAVHAGVGFRALTDADCVIGVVPSLGGAAAAAYLARRCRAPYGLIFQDLVGNAAAQSGLPGGGVAARPVQSIERWVASRAAGIGIVAEAFRPYLESAGVAPERISHLPNWTHVVSPTGCTATTRQRFGWTRTEIVVLHAGNMGFKQDLSNVIAAARLSDAASLPHRFVFMGDGAERRRLEHESADLPNVQFLDPQPGDTFMEVLAAADVLVLNERATVLDMSLPSKITSYFRAGRPVVAAVPVAGSTAKELARSGGASVTEAGHPAELLAAIIEVTADPESARALVRHAAAYATLHYDSTALLGRIDDFIGALLTSPRIRSAP